MKYGVSDDFQNYPPQSLPPTSMRQRFNRFPPPVLTSSNQPLHRWPNCSPPRLRLRLLHTSLRFGFWRISIFRFVKNKSKSHHTADRVARYAGADRREAPKACLPNFSLCRLPAESPSLRFRICFFLLPVCLSKRAKRVMSVRQCSDSIRHYNPLIVVSA